MALGLAPGVFIWALLWALGISALVAASEAAFVVLKVVGGAALIYLGARSLFGEGRLAAAGPRRRTAFRDGLATGLANPKLAVFFVALFPQLRAGGVVGSAGGAGNGRAGGCVRPGLVLVARPVRGAHAKGARRERPRAAD